MRSYCSNVVADNYKKKSFLFFFFFEVIKRVQLWFGKRKVHWFYYESTRVKYFLQRLLTVYRIVIYRNNSLNADFAQSKEERMVITIGEIIQELLKAHRDNRDVDLNKLKTRISSKYGLDRSPRLVDIIAAVPADARNILVPKLKAKPVRTASGVCFSTS